MGKNEHLFRFEWKIKQHSFHQTIPFSMNTVFHFKCTYNVVVKVFIVLINTQQP